MKKLILVALVLGQVVSHAQVAARIGGGINQRVQTSETATEAMEFWTYYNSAYGITNQPILWMKASAHRWRASDGDAVAEALDYSGNNLNLGQSSSTKRPTWIKSGFNSSPTFRFDGGDCLTNPAVSASTYTVFIVMSNSAHGIVMEHSADASANNGSYIYSTTTCGHLVTRAGSTSSKNGTTGWGINNVILTEASYDGTHAGNTGTTNGVLVFAITCSASADPGTSTASAAINIGGRNNTSTFITGHVSEILWYSPKLSSGDATIVRNRLKGKFSLTY